MLLVGGIPVVYLYINASAAVQSTTEIDDGNWHHVAGTYDGTTARVYFDGVEEDSDTVTPPLTKAQNFRIGAWGGNTGDPANGSMKDFRSDHHAPSIS